MKRILSIVLTLVLLFGILGGTSVSAEGLLKLTYTSASGGRGDTVSITVNIEANSGFSLMRVTPNYDSSALTLVDTVNGDVHSSMISGVNPTWNGNAVNIVNTGKLVTFKFKINDNAPLGNYPVNVIVRDCYDATDADVTVENNVPGTISVVCAHSYGAWSKLNDNQHQRTCSKCNTPETANHKWDAGKVTKEPTCKETGIRTYTCSDCKATKEETISVKPHSFGAWERISDTQHKRTCTLCKTETETANHKWDAGEVTKEATCKDTGIRTYTCSDCKGTKEEVIPVDPTAHKFGTTWTDADDAKHEMVCTVCKTEKKQENHKYDGGKVTKEATCKDTGIRTYTCSVCKGTKEEVIPVDPNAHKLGAWTDADDEKHTQSCTLCGTVQKQEAHKYDAGKVTKDSTCKETGIRTYTCSVCKGTKEEVIPVKPHSFGKWENVSDTQHKRTCTMCKTETETAAHAFGEAWSKDKDQHFKACECGAKKDAANHIPGAEPTEKEPQLCTVCAYIIKPALGHTHTWDTKLTTDETGHWFDCPGCEEKKDFKAHDFENDCDDLCETCQYKRVTEHKFGEDWVSDETGHFHACSVCGEKIEFAEHTPGAEATEETAQTCTVCAFEIAPALGHTHDFGDKWLHDNKDHWHQCKCGELADLAAHTLDDANICSVCGAAVEVAGEASGEPFPWWLLLIAVAIIGVLLFFGLKKKKK